MVVKLRIEGTGLQVGDSAWPQAAAASWLGGAAWSSGLSALITSPAMFLVCAGYDPVVADRLALIEARDADGLQGGAGPIARRAGHDRIDAGRHTLGSRAP